MPTTEPPPEMSTSRPVTERRRRPRLAGETLGWLLPQVVPLAVDGRSLPDEEVGWEVRVHDVSRLGVGFSTTEPLDPGSRRRLRIGRGPAGRARAIRVVICRRDDAGLFHVGAEFADAGSIHPHQPVGGLARAG
jgi:hypothetical protein